jgi:hypothetical protein
LHETPGRERRLGRHVHFDSRSKAHRVVLEAASASLVSKTWERKLGALNQGDLGSCTAQGCIGVLATMPNLHDGVGDGAKFDQDLARKIYKVATLIDDERGSWPPTDTGSSVLCAMKAARALDLISGFKWCLSTDDVLQTLSHHGPVEVGFTWTAGFDEPDALGRVSIKGKNEGGHAFQLIGIDVENERVIAVNSWGPGFGIKGRFSFSWSDLRKLMKDDGEAVFVLPPKAVDVTTTTNLTADVADDSDTVP